MADELLSINTETLDAIGAAIRGKNGQSGLMSPAQMATALGALDTYDAAQDKVTHADKVLTPTDTSYSIPVGVHDGTETVSIQLDAQRTVTPSSSAQTIQPSDANHFLSSVLVKGTSGGYKVLTGTVTGVDAKSITISNLGITPVGAALVYRSTKVSSYSASVSSHISVPSVESATRSQRFYRGILEARASTAVTFGSGYVTFKCDYKYQQNYAYVVWGN